MLKITETFITINDCRHRLLHLTHSDQQNSNTLVFLHDALGSIDQWKDFPSKIAEQTGLDALLYDRQGHGQSSPFVKDRDIDFLNKEAYEVLPQLLEKLKIIAPILIGHSDGGTIALLYASRFPTKAIIPIASHTFVEEETLQGIKRAKEVAPVITLLLKKHHGDKMTKLFEQWHNTWLSESFRDWNIFDALKSISCPALIIQGEKDEYGTEEQVWSITRNIKGKATEFMVAGAGHIPHLEKADVVQQKVTTFIKEVLN